MPRKSKYNNLLPLLSEHWKQLGIKNSSAGNIFRLYEQIKLSAISAHGPTINNPDLKEMDTKRNKLKNTLYVWVRNMTIRHLSSNGRIETAVETQKGDSNHRRMIAGPPMQVSKHTLQMPEAEFNAANRSRRLEKTLNIHQEADKLWRQTILLFGSTCETHLYLLGRIFGNGSITSIPRDMLISYLKVPRDFTNEIEVIEVVLKWMLDTGERDGTSIFDLVRFDTMSEENLKALLALDLKDQPEIESLLKYYVKLALAPLRKDPSPIQKRSMYILAGCINGKPISRVWAAPVKSDTGAGDFWPISNIPEPTCEAVCAILRGKVYVAASDSKPDLPASCWVFNPCDTTWTRAPFLTGRKRCFTLTALGSMLIAVGGKGIQDEILSSCESLYVCNSGNLPSYGGWVTDQVPHLPQAVFNHAACEQNGLLYITGGYTRDNDEHGATAELYHHNRNEKKWDKLEHMNHKRASHGMIANERNIFVFGGQDMPSSAESYDLSVKQWTNLTSMPGPQKQAYAFYISETGIVYVTGSGKSMYIYHMHKHQWQVSDQQWLWMLKWPYVFVVIDPNSKAQPQMQNNTNRPAVATYPRTEALTQGQIKAHRSSRDGSTHDQCIKIPELKTMDGCPKQLAVSWTNYPIQPSNA